MGSRMRIVITVLSVGLVGGAAAETVGAASAKSPRAELKASIEQLQKTPDDTALREKIIKLASTLKPPPALPEEAERRMARGSAAFKGAKSVADYLDAAKEYEQATLSAPWYGDAYFNLGVAQDKAENYEGALSSLKLAQEASRDSKQVKALLYEVEFRRDKKAAEEKKKREFDLSGVYRQERGSHWVGRPDVDYHDASHYEFEVQGKSVVVYQTIDIATMPGYREGMRWKLYEGAVEGRELALIQTGVGWKSLVRVSEDCNTLDFYKVLIEDGSEFNNGRYQKLKLIREGR